MVAKIRLMKAEKKLLFSGKMLSAAGAVKWRTGVSHDAAIDACSKYEETIWFQIKYRWINRKAIKEARKHGC